MPPHCITRLLGKKHQAVAVTNVLCQSTALFYLPDSLTTNPQALKNATPGERLITTCCAITAVRLAIPFGTARRDASAYVDFAPTQQSPALASAHRKSTTTCAKRSMHRTDFLTRHHRQPRASRRHATAMHQLFMVDLQAPERETREGNL